MFEYTHANSFIHRLDPRTKLIYSACMLIAVLVVYSFPILLFLFITSLFIWVSAKIVSLRTAKQMSLSLESKAFGYKKERTSLKTLEFTLKDGLFSLFSIFIVVLSLILFYIVSW